MRCYHICIIKTNLISPCSHPDAHPNLNREVRRSPTWHSSESESALERFEPVAAAMLWLDGQGTLFAPVAARRQKVFKRGKRSSFCPFRSFRTSEKNTIRKVTLRFFAGEHCSTLRTKPKYSQQTKQKIKAPSAFSFAHAGAKEKAIKKKTPMGIDTYAEHVCRRRRDGEISRFAKRDHRCRWTTPPFEKGGRKL